MRGGKAVYNDVASPLGKTVDSKSNNRHRDVSTMFPTWTPRVEHIVDFLVKADDDRFPVLHNRLRMLAALFPRWSTRAERIIDYLLRLDDEKFAVLCHHYDGMRFEMTADKLEIIGDALEATNADEAVELDLSFQLLTDEERETRIPTLDEIDDPTDSELADVAEHDAAALLHEARRLRMTA
jgi:Ran GTPase-activating protein (RanGAP) involved in mRNA processing and transport